MTRDKLFLGLVFSMCFSVGLSAQDATVDPAPPAATETTDAAQDSTEKKKGKKGRNAAKKAERQLNKMFKNISKKFAAVELTEEQTASLKEIIGEHQESLQGFQSQIDEFMEPEQRKEVNQISQQARKDGKSWKEAMAMGYEAIGMSEEDQEAVRAVVKSRNEVNETIVATFTETLTDEQKEAIAAANDEMKEKRGKGKGKGKGKRGGKKKMKDGDESDDDGSDSEGKLTAVSITLPGMT